MKISLVIPSYNESESLPKLLTQIQRIADAQSWSEYEIIVIDDGSNDNTFSVLSAIKKIMP